MEGQPRPAETPTVTTPTVGLQATADRQAEGSTDSASHRVRAVFVTGPDSQQSTELYGLLLKRLRIYTLILAGAFLFYFTLTLATFAVAIQGGVFEELGGPSLALVALVSTGLPLLVMAPCVAVLRWRPPLLLQGLRAIELLCTGTVAVLFLWGMIVPQGYEVLERAAQETARTRSVFLTCYGAFWALGWFGLLVGYGTLIPNTWSRSAAVVGTLGVSPLLLVAVFGFWLRPLETSLVLLLLAFLAFWIGTAVAVVVFASYRIEVLQREAAAARKLGQYRLGKRLGAGGMGEVYLAEHVLLRRPCAIKLIRPERAGDVRNLRRFEREVKSTAMLTHPNTVQIFDYGRAEDGTFYYVMEYLPGQTLEQLVELDGALPPARVIHLLRQVCGGLREAHAAGLIHRDLKPSNIMVCERGGLPDTAKLLDFGLVVPVQTLTGDKLTQEGTLTGTPAYMSPEQAGGQETLDARSDIYSVGAVAYFLLTGRPPFANRSAVKILAAHLYEEPEPITTLRPEVPADLAAIVLRCLAKEPGKRFPDTQSLEAAMSQSSVSPGNRPSQV